VCWMGKHTSNRPLVLILEDEALVALNLQEEIEEAGYSVAGPFTSCSAALAWLRANRPDAAILDTMVKDGTCREIAEELGRRNIPFLIYSGHREDAGLQAAFPLVTWIEKPVPPSVLVAGCQQLLNGGNSPNP